MPLLQQLCKQLIFVPYFLHSKFFISKPAYCCKSSQPASQKQKIIQWICCERKSRNNQAKIKNQSLVRNASPTFQNHCQHNNQSYRSHGPKINIVFLQKSKRHPNNNNSKNREKSYCCCAERM